MRNPRKRPFLLPIVDIARRGVLGSCRTKRDAGTALHKRLRIWSPRATGRRRLRLVARSSFGRVRGRPFCVPIVEEGGKAPCEIAVGKTQLLPCFLVFPRAPLLPDAASFAENPMYSAAAASRASRGRRRQNGSPLWRERAQSGGRFRGTPPEKTPSKRKRHETCFFKKALNKEKHKVLQWKISACVPRPPE